MWTIDELEDLVVEKFTQRLEYEYDPNEEDDIITVMDEVIEMRVPLWTTDILEIALSCPYLATMNSEIGPAWNKDTPVNHIIMNIYNHCYEKIAETYTEYKNKKTR